jgi:hypothetical protein
LGAKHYAPNEAQLVHNFRVQSAGTAKTSEPISSGNRERFLGNIFSGRDMQVGCEQGRQESTCSDLRPAT